MFKISLHALIALIGATVFASTPIAAPWIAPSDLHLRADLQRLAAEGVITVPVATYPLMWQGIISDLQQYTDQPLSPSARSALERVRARAEQEAHANSQVRQQLELKIGSDEARFQHFGSHNRDQASITLRSQFHHQHLAGNLILTYSHDADDGQEVRYDGSYLAARYGNWILSAGRIEKWYGPGYDSALLVSNNARPLLGINLTRDHAKPFASPWLSWLGPWTFTTGVSWMDDNNRYIQDTLLFDLRINIRPLAQLEIGMARIAQLCGRYPSQGVRADQDRPCDLSTWGKMFIGEDNRGVGGIDLDNEPGNQQASVDLRWSDTFNGLAYGIYTEWMGEDSFDLGKIPPFGKISRLVGADLSYQLGQQQITTYLEYSNTDVTCQNSNSCAYEHSIYRSGLRYYDRTIGSTYDNDANTIVLGNIGINTQNNHQWKINLRWLDLNRDDQNRFVDDGGGNKASPRAQTVSQLEGVYRLPFFNGQLEFTADIANIKQSENNDEIKTNIWASWQYPF